MKKFLKDYQFLLIILGIALILRLISINQSFWLDETTSGYVARDLNFNQIISKFSPGDFNPPLYYFILRLWGMVFGYTEVALRSLSVTAGIFSIIVLYKIILELNFKTVSKTENMPYLAALLLATSGLHIYFSQEARMYMLASLFVLISFYYFVKTINRGRAGEKGQLTLFYKYKYFLGYSIFLTLAIFTHYQTVFMIPVYFVAALVYKKRFSWWINFFASHIIFVISLLAWFPVLFSQLGLGIETKGASPVWWRVLGKTDLKQIALLPLKFIIGRVSLENQKLYFALALSLTLGYLWIVVKSYGKTKKIKIVWLWFLLPIILSAIVGLKLSIFSYSRLFFVLPAFYILISLGICNTKTRFRLALVVLIIGVNLISSFIYLFNNKFHREDWKDMINFQKVESRDKNSITILQSNTGREAYLYYDSQKEIYATTDIGKINGNYDIIWLNRYAQPIFDTKDKVKTDIESLGYEKVEEDDFNGVIIWKYSR